MIPDQWERSATSGRFEPEAKIAVSRDRLVMRQIDVRSNICLRRVMAGRVFWFRAAARAIWNRQVDTRRRRAVRQLPRIRGRVRRNACSCCFRSRLRDTAVPAVLKVF